MKPSLFMIFAEGFLDRIAAERLAREVGLEVEGAVKDAGGIPEFWKSIGKLNEAAKQCGPIFALADHDSLDCVGPKLSQKLPVRHPNLLLRLSVVELEAWLLADSERLGEHLSVSAAQFPSEPDKERDPKRTLVSLAARSTKPSIKQGMVPRPGYKADRGPEYTAIMEDFIQRRWRPAEAATRSPSLRRAIAALHAVRERGNS